LGVFAGVAAVIALAGVLAGGFYTIKADQRGVLRRFGNVVEQVGPGIRFRLPWPIEQVDIVRTTSVMKTGVGFALPENDSESVTGVAFLTSDTNIIEVALALQYVIRDPADFLLRIDDPRGFVSALAQSELAETVATMPVDEVLTTGRLAIQNAVRAKTQAVLDRERSGIQIISASIVTIALDRAVAESFQEVADAMADREKTQNEARTYASSMIPKARGEAQASVGAAQNYKTHRIAEAVGDTTRFVAIATEYRKAPDVTRERLYLEAIEKALARSRLYVVDVREGGVPLRLRLAAPP
jgi:membrane protease subunit HflK